MTKANSAFHPSGVGKWVPASAGKAKAGMVYSVSGWTRGVQVKLKSLENVCHTWVPKRRVHDEALYKSTFTFTFKKIATILSANGNHPPPAVDFWLRACHERFLRHRAHKLLVYGHAQTHRWTDSLRTERLHQPITSEGINTTTITRFPSALTLHEWEIPNKQANY